MSTNRNAEQKGAQHTPGPWTAFEPATHVDGISHMIKSDCPSEGFWRIADIGTHNGRAEAGANARLIAAAPDMLTALHDALEIIQTAKQYFPKSIKHSDKFRLLNIEANSIRKAIAKATGQE